MERLSIDEVIEHCNKICDMTEKIAKAQVELKEWLLENEGGY